MSEKPKFVYVIYIAATPEKVFDALTDGPRAAQHQSVRTRQRQMFTSHANGGCGCGVGAIGVEKDGDAQTPLRQHVLK